MVDYTTGCELEVLWHGGMQNDPLGGFTKGCLTPPREQTEDEQLRTRVVPFDDIGLSLAELERAVNRYAGSVKGYRPGSGKNNRGSKSWW